MHSTISMFTVCVPVCLYAILNGSLVTLWLLVCVLRRIRISSKRRSSEFRRSCIPRSVDAALDVVATYAMVRRQRWEPGSLPP